MAKAKHKLLFFLGLTLQLWCNGCMSLEERCNIDMANRRFNSYQECMAFRWRQQEVLSEKMHREQQDYFRSQYGASVANGECNGFTPAPYAGVNCKKVCVNGRWNEICDSGY